MCDYSLENQISRAAEVGDELVTTRFRGSTTRGFCAAGSPRVAVCLLPGTELVFDKPVTYRGFWGVVHRAMRKRSRTARFRQIDTDIPTTHHDALELDNGHVVLLTLLREGQRATVLQLPVKPDQGKRRAAEITIPVAETAY
jgi:hypothetical protein